MVKIYLENFAKIHLENFAEICFNFFAEIHLKNFVDIHLENIISLPTTGMLKCQRQHTDNVDILFLPDARKLCVHLNYFDKFSLDILAGAQGLKSCV